MTEIRQSEAEASLSEIIVTLPDITTLQVPKIELSQLSVFDRSKIKVLINRGVLEEIPKGCVLMDVGCGDGGVGMAVAALRGAYLIQADVCERRNPQCRSGKLVKLPTTPFKFEGNNKVEVILLIDVLQHVRSYEGMDAHQTRIAFLEALLSALTPKGKIVISGVNHSGDFLSKNDYLPKLVEKNKTLEIFNAIGRGLNHSSSVLPPISLLGATKR